MPNCGDNYTFVVKNTHINWGEVRETESREKIAGEVYLPIPAEKARLFNVYNSSQVGANIEYTVTTDGFVIDGKLKAQGTNSGGTGEYAKNLSGSGNLKLLGPWVMHKSIKTGDSIKVEWTSPTNIKLTKI